MELLLAIFEHRGTYDVETSRFYQWIPTHLKLSFQKTSRLLMIQKMMSGKI